MTNQRIVIVFGGRSPIAIDCALWLSKGWFVILVTRKIDQLLLDKFNSLPSVSLIEANLERLGEAKRVIQYACSFGRKIGAILFLQRYRGGDNELFESHLAVEIFSTKEAIEATHSYNEPGSRVNVLVASSPAAHGVLIDQTLEYHIVKAGQEALVRYLSIKLAKFGMCINSIRIGSLVRKPRAKVYWDSIANVLDHLEKISPSGVVQTSELLAARICGLLSADLDGVTGQVFNIDDGFGLMDAAQLAKNSAERSL